MFYTLKMPTSGFIAKKKPIKPKVIENPTDFYDTMLPYYFLFPLHSPKKVHRLKYAITHFRRQLGQQKI